MGGKFDIAKMLDPAGIFTKEETPAVQQSTDVNTLPQTPTEADDSVTRAAEEERRRRRAAAGSGSTLLSGANSLSGGGSALTGKKTLLGG